MLSHWISFPPDRWGRWGYSEVPRSLWFLQVAASANHFQWKLWNIWNICDSSKRLRLKNDRCHSNQEAAVIWRSDGFSRRGRLQNLSAERWLLKESESDVKSNQVSTLHQCAQICTSVGAQIYFCVVNSQLSQNCIHFIGDMMITHYWYLIMMHSEKLFQLNVEIGLM